MTTITLEHVSKQFEQNVLGKQAMIAALQDVSLKIASGDVLAILGPSGCGKSTLLRLIAGLAVPDSGHVLYDNVPLDDIPMKERGVGMVFQDHALMPHWETIRSVGFFLSLRRREHEVPDRVKRISQITGVGIEHLLDRLPSQLSGGERQRLSIARALARDPRVFLFDEPFSNLDAKLRQTARVELNRLLREFPVTSVYVTHDQTEAMALAHRIAVMRDGRMEQVNTYKHLYANPINVFVATFIGTPGINLFEGYVQVNGGEQRWQGQAFGGFRIRGDLPEGTRVTMGIRPEFMRLASSGVEAVVESITPYYAEGFLLVELRAGRERWQLTVPPDTRLALRETVYCTLDAESILYFDTRTGTRIG